MYTSERYRCIQEVYKVKYKIIYIWIQHICIHNTILMTAV